MIGESTRKPLDIARCFNDAMDVYRENFFTFFLAAILFDLLSIATLMILGGPMWGGIVLMSLRSMTDRAHRARLGDMFGAFDRFGPLVAIFFITSIAQLAGFALFLLPGLLIAAMWLFPTFLMVDQNLGVIESLSASWRIVRNRGIGINLAAACIITVLEAVPCFIPYVGWLVAWFVTPLAWLIVTSAYIQEVREQFNEDELRPGHGFPVIASVAPQPQ
jgi:hypothetical protein